MDNLSKATPVNIEYHKNPFLTPFQSIQDELDKAIAAFYMPGLRRSFFSHSFENLLIKPSIDIVDDKDSFKVEVELPGLSEKEITVSIGNGTLIIKGEKETSKKDQGKNYIAREITYGRYERSISLPESIDISKADASFKKGMLWINIPKKAGASKDVRDLKIQKAA